MTDEHIEVIQKKLAEMELLLNEERARNMGDITYIPYKEIIYDEIDWSLTRINAGRSTYYEIHDKVSGTSIRVEYHEDAWVLREMLKVMRLDCKQQERDEE